jgi:hypothetical protein
MRFASHPVGFGLGLVLIVGGCGPRDGMEPVVVAGSTSTASPSEDELEQACVDHVNALRATKQLPALTRWKANEACADAQAQNDSMTGKAHGAFFSCPNLAQNECPDWRSTTGARGIVPGCLDLMWAEGPGGGHYENMIRHGYTFLACGFYTTPDGRVWSVQDFR